MTTNQLRWGLLAAGGIAAEFADGVARSDTGTVVAVAARDADRAAAFASTFGIERSHGSYEALLADPDVDIVYISTLHPQHAEWAIKATEAGKHVLCEKPLTMNAADSARVIDSARRNDVFLMEAFMYRSHPQTDKLVELVRSGVLGELRAIDVAFSYDAGRDPRSRAYLNELGGGGILDIGCYGTSIARLVVAAATGVDVAEPSRIVATARLHPTEGTDLESEALLTFDGGINAHLSCAVDYVRDNHVRVFGTDAWIDVPVPSWLDESRHAGTSHLLVHHADGRTETVDAVATKSLFTYEADTVARALPARQSPTVTWDETLANMRTLDRWREAIGLVYNCEKKEAS